MGTLRLVGLGLSPHYISRAAVEALRTSDKIYFESYTVPQTPWTPEVLSEIIGAGVEVLERSDIEDESAARIFEELEKGLTVSLAVAGDPFIATTHNTLLVEAVRRGHRVERVYGVSAHCAAIAASGLFVYRFGKSATIVYPRDGISYDYPYMVLEENLERNLHTLFYLDIRDDGHGMTIDEALRILLDSEMRLKHDIITPSTLVVGLMRLGLPDECIAAAPIEEFLKTGGHRLPDPPHMLIVPAKLHFAEEDALGAITRVWGTCLRSM